MLIASVALALAAGVLSPPAQDSLSARIRGLIAAVPGAEVAVAYRSLAHGADTLYLNADTSFHAASTMKVPVMIELFRQAESGQLPLDQRILLVNQFGSIVDGSPYALDPGADSDSSLYALVGTRVPVRLLLERMIERSSNLATNALIALVGAQRVQATVNALGAPGMRVLRGVEDGKAYDRGLNNTTTARALATLLAAIETGQAASPASSRAMRSILLRQEFNSQIPAGLPPGTPVAHKTGWITGILHDAAIVYPRESTPYVLVVLTRGIPDRTVAAALTADISRVVFQHATGAPLAP